MIKIVNLTKEFAILTVIPTKKAKAEIETQPVILETKISKSSL